MATQLSCAVFEPHRRSAFTVEMDEGRSVELVLAEVTDNTPAGFPGEQFSLTFEGPVEPALTQNIFALNHKVLGRLDLFLVPIGMSGASRLYEASFSLMS